jgi:hypothetical protein
VDDDDDDDDDVAAGDNGNVMLMYCDNLSDTLCVTVCWLACVNKAC